MTRTPVGPVRLSAPHRAGGQTPCAKTEDYPIRWSAYFRRSEPVRPPAVPLSGGPVIDRPTYSGGQLQPTHERQHPDFTQATWRR